MFPLTSRAPAGPQSLQLHVSPPGHPTFPLGSVPDPRPQRQAQTRPRPVPKPTRHFQIVRRGSCDPLGPQVSPRCPVFRSPLSDSSQETLPGTADPTCWTLTSTCGSRVLPELWVLLLRPRWERLASQTSLPGHNLQQSEQTCLRTTPTSSPKPLACSADPAPPRPRALSLVNPQTPTRAQVTTPFPTVSRRQAALEVTARYCSRELDQYGQCVAAKPESWQRDCHHLKMSIAQCTSSQ